MGVLGRSYHTGKKASIHPPRLGGMVRLERSVELIVEININGENDDALSGFGTHIRVEANYLAASDVFYYRFDKRARTLE